MKSPALVTVKCKGCNLIVEIASKNFEFIYKTGFCQWCLIEKGYCS